MLDYEKVVAQVELIQENMRGAIKEAVCSKLSMDNSNLIDAKQGIGQIIGIDYYVQNLLKALDTMRED